MAFQKPLPEWKQPGIRPPESKIKEGYQVLDKPPAAWLNWQMNTTYEALQELHEKAAEKEDVSQALGEAKAYTDEKVADIDLTKISPGSIGAAKQADLDAHAADAVKHITVAERAAWNGKANSNHTHDAAAITSGTIAAARLPAATTTGHGVVRLYDGVDGNAPSYSAASPGAVKQVYDELMLVKQCVVDGKGMIAEAVNGKGGGPVSAYNTFPELVAGITKITTGGILNTSFSDHWWSANTDVKVVAATVPATSYMIFSSKEYSGWETGTAMEALRGRIRMTMFIRDSNNLDFPIFEAVSSTDSDFGTKRLYNLEVDLRKSSYQVRFFYNFQNYGSPTYEEKTLPANFNKTGGIRIVYGVQVWSTASDGVARASLRGTVAYQ